MTTPGASSSRRPSLRWVLPWALLFAGCAHDIDKQDPPPAYVQAIFEPALGILPSPTDLAKNSQTGLLQVPVADEEKQPAQAALDRYLNTLDGFPVSSAVSFCLSDTVDAATLGDAVKVVALPGAPGDVPEDISDSMTVTGPIESDACPVVTSEPCDPTAEPTGCGDAQRCISSSSNVETLGLCADAGYRVIITNPKPWERDRTYGFFLGDTVKDPDGGPVIRSANFELAVAVEPLCALDADTRQCTYNYAVPIASAVDDQVRAERPDLSEEELESAVRAQELVTATGFEQLRQAMDQLVQASPVVGLQRENVLLAWAFSTTTQVEAIFDPANGIIPGPPNDIVMSDGKVALPESPGETEREKALRLALNTLDGFSTTAPQWTIFSGALDAATVKAGGELMVIQIASGSLPQLVDPAPSFSYSAASDTIASDTIEMRPSAPLEEKSRYAVVLLSRQKTQQISGADGQPVDALSVESGGGLSDDDGRRVVASPTFALVRSPGPLVDDDGKSTVSVLSDAEAELLEPLRQGYDPLFGALEAIAGVQREDVVALWTFTTQSITEPLIDLRTGTYERLLDEENPAGGDDLSPGPLLVNDPTLNGFGFWPEPAPRDAIETFLFGGAFTGWNALNPETDLLEPGLGGVSQTETVPLWVTIPKKQPCLPDDKCPFAGFSCSETEPKVCEPDDGWPVVVFQHGLGASRVQFFPVANTLASFGFAAVAFDVVYHGERSACSKDEQCVNPAGAEPAAFCDTEQKPRRCCVGADAAKECGPQFLLRDENGIPLASGEKFLDAANPFALKSNMLQHVIDSVALLRALRFDGETGLLADDGSALGVQFDQNNVHYAAHSLGAILGVLVLAVDPLNQGEGPKRAFLNVPGAPVVQIFQDTQNPAFQQTIADLLAGLGVEAGSAEALQLFHVLQWVLDPVDPANFAAFVAQQQLVYRDASGDAESTVPQKDLLVQIAPNDRTIPGARQAALADWLGADVSQSTYEDTENHIFLLSRFVRDPDTPADQQPPDDPVGLLPAAQLQMGTFLATGAVCTPDVTVGTCEVGGAQ